MGKKPKPKRPPSPAIRTENWAGKRPPRVREVDEFAEQAFYTSRLPDVENEQDKGEA